LALLVGASLMMTTAWNLSRTEIGFDPANVLDASIALESHAYPDPARQRAGASRILAALEALPEVETASLITGPSFGFRQTRPVFRGVAAEPDAPRAVMVGVTSSYFRAVRLTVLAGRALSPSDTAEGEPVAVISSSLARTLWPSSSAVDQTITTAALRPMRDGVEIGSEKDAMTQYRVVGVVADVRRSLWRPPVPEIYVPLVQAPRPNLTLQVRGRDGVPRSAVAAAVARAVSAVDPELPLNGATPLEAVIARQGARSRFLATVLCTFASLAAVAGLIGLYAISAWVARQRRREAAIRLALGAEPTHVIRQLMTSGTLAVTIGLAIGWWTSMALGRLLSGELAGVSGGDVRTRFAIAVVLFFFCVLAVYRPARAATKISPAATLRE
jgi:putative ABC transport system permease protein